MNNTALDLVDFPVPPGAPPRPSVQSEPLRVATPVAEPGPAAADSPFDALVLAFPEPALVFDWRRLCTCINESGAQALGVNRRRIAGLDAVALGLPAAIDEAIRQATDPYATNRGREREVFCSRGAGARRFHVTPHPETGEVLVTWSDFSPSDEAARRLAQSHESLRAWRGRAVADGRRRRGTLARLRTELEKAVTTLASVAEDVTAQAWGLPPSRPPGDALSEESRRLRTLLQHLAQLDKEEATAQAAQADAVEL